MVFTMKNIGFYAEDDHDRMKVVQSGQMQSVSPEDGTDWMTRRKNLVPMMFVGQSVMVVVETIPVISALVVIGSPYRVWTTDLNRTRTVICKVWGLKMIE